jgi:ion channel-forming bestrophin family protein
MISMSASKLLSSRLRQVNAYAGSSSRLLSTVATSDIEPEFVKRGLPVTIKPQFYVPKSERGTRKLYNVEFRFGEERLARSGRRDPTRELNMTSKHWKAHKSPFRKWRHLLITFRSSVFQRLAFPDLFVSGSVASFVVYYNEFIAVSESAMHLQMGGFAGATTAIGLLAGFRLKESYGRYDECRKFWGETINTTRDLGRNTMMWMKDEKQKSRMLKLIKAFPVAYNFHVNRKGGHHNLHESDKNKPKFGERIQAEFQAEMLDIYLDGGNDDDLRRICEVKYKGGNIGLEVLNLMGETIAGSVGTVDAIYVREMDEQVQRLCDAFGASERILGTPLPTSFTRHTSRVLAIWDFLLPFAMYPMMGCYATIPVCLITSFAVLGIEDVGVQLEDPFDVLPLRQYSDCIFDSLNQTEKNYVPYVIEGPGVCPWTDTGRG